MTAATALISLSVPTEAPAQAAPEAVRTSGNDLRFIRSLPGPEDLVQVPGTNWIIASSFAGLDSPRTFNGGLALIDPASRTLTKVVLNPADVARAPYAACRTPPNPTRFSTHGLNIRREASGRSTLFVVGHGGREAIEVFDVAVTEGRPMLTWIGCVLATDGAFNNSIVGLPDGRILVTDFLHGSKTMADLFANRKTGAVYRWTPGHTWEKLPGTDLSGPNGIEVSADQRYMFVADSGSATVLRYDLQATDTLPLAIKPGFRTDNVRWSSDGRLLLAGTKADSTCKPDNQKCPKTLFVKALDPDTLALTTLLEMPAAPTFSNLSSALIVEDTLWLGAPKGDRIAYKELPRATTGRKSTAPRRSRAD